MGRYMGRLTIGMSRHDLSYVESNDSDYCERDKTHFIDYIFKYCSSLVELTLIDTILVRCNPQMEKSRSLQALHLRGCTIHPHILEDLSCRLPHLDALHIIDCAFSKILNESSCSRDDTNNSIITKKCGISRNKYNKKCFDGSIE